MTTPEKLQLLARLKTLFDEQAEVDRSIAKAFGSNPESAAFTATAYLQEFAVEQVSRRIGDTVASLAWHVYENDWGRKKLKAGIGADLRPIETVKDLLWLIEARS